MIARRTLLASVAAVPVHFNWTAAHPDAALLALCAQLEQQQAEWQRLYDATSDADALTTPADFAWQSYSEGVWPGIHLSAWNPAKRDPADIAARLVDLSATTPDGLRAKATAVLAMEEAGSYLMDCRNDSAELMASVLRDAAGSGRRPLGAEAHPPSPLRLDPQAA